MKELISLFVCLTISAVSFGQDKTASIAAAADIPPGPTIKETEKWVKNELPSFGSFSVVKVKSDDRYSLLTHKYGIENTALSDCRFSVRKTEVVSSETLGEFVRLHDTYLVPMKDIDLGKIRLLRNPSSKATQSAGRVTS